MKILILHAQYQLHGAKVLLWSEMELLETSSWSWCFVFPNQGGCKGHALIGSMEYWCSSKVRQKNSGNSSQDVVYVTIGVSQMAPLILEQLISFVSLNRSYHSYRLLVSFRQYFYTKENCLKTVYNNHFLKAVKKVYRSSIVLTFACFFVVWFQ
jgi:hypothetical protein